MLKHVGLLRNQNHALYVIISIMSVMFRIRLQAVSSKTKMTRVTVLAGKVMQRDNRF